MNRYSGKKGNTSAQKVFTLLYNRLMSFTEKAYYQERFNRLDLTRDKIQGVVFEECEFLDCSFIDCRLEKCKFISCKFQGCVLSAVVPMDCRLQEAKFSECKVIGIDWTKAQQVENLDFSECQVNYSSFKLMKVPKIRMVKCEAREVDFTEADLSNGEFRNTDFEKSRFFKTNLSGADFKGATNYYIDVKNNTLKKTRFSLPEALTLLESLDIVLE